MSEKKVWFVTGAGRGMGVDIARAALAAGHAVVATGRNPERVSAAVGAHDDLLTVALDITDPASAQAAVDAAVERFGRIDVLVNNAGNFYAGLLRGDQPGGLPGAGRDQPVRPAERHPRRAAGDARPALRARGDHQLHRRPDRAGVLHRLRRVEVRPRGLDGVADPRGRAVRHPHDGRRARLLPHRPAHAGVDELRRALDRRLRRAHPADRHRLERHERPAGRRPRQARHGAGPARRRWTSRRCAGSPAPTPSRASSRRPGTCSPRWTPTGSCPPRWPTTTPRRAPEGGPASTPIARLSLIAAEAGFLGWCQFDTDGMD